MVACLPFTLVYLSQSVSLVLRMSRILINQTLLTEKTHRIPCDTYTNRLLAESDHVAFDMYGSNPKACLSLSFFF